MFGHMCGFSPINLLMQTLLVYGELYRRRQHMLSALPVFPVCMRRKSIGDLGTCFKPLDVFLAQVYNWAHACSAPHVLICFLTRKHFCGVSVGCFCVAKEYFFFWMCGSERFFVCQNQHKAPFTEVF